MKSLGESERCFKYLKMDKAKNEELCSASTLMMALQGNMLGRMS